MALTKVNFRMIDGSVANVRDFGADPTGVSDSAAAFQAALDASNDVFIPAGTYKVLSQINLNTNTYLFGEGVSSTIQCDTADINILSAVSKTDVMIANLKITGVESTTNGNAIYFSGCRDCVVDHIEVTGVSGAGVLATAGSVRIRVSNSRFDAFTGTIQDSAGISFYLNANNCIAENNICTNATWHGIRCQLDSLNHIIKNNYVEGALAYGILAGYENVDAISQGVVDGNIIKDIEGSVLISGDRRAGAGIYSQSVYGLKIVNNTLARCNKQTVTEVLVPAAIGVSGRVTVSNNFIYDTSWYGIGIFSEDEASIVSNNIIKNSAKTAIYLKNGLNGIVDGNFISFATPQRGILAVHQTGVYRFVNISNNTVVNGSDAIAIINGAHFTIANNVVDDATGRGIDIQNSPDGAVIGNMVKNTTGDAFRVATGSNIQVTGNTFMSVGTYSITTSGTLSDVHINENIQSPYVVAISDGSYVSFRDDNVPTSGEWSRGSRVYDNTPSAGGTIGWVCTSSGSPGTWKTFGAITA
jgi:hypothetical protein